MRRRDFFKTLSLAAAGFSILPSAMTYQRRWALTREKVWIPNPDYEEAPYEVEWNGYYMINGKPLPNPLRFRFVEGKYQTVPPVILA